MKTQLVRIGNSRGVRIPKPLIEQVGLDDEVEMVVRAGSIVITPLTQPRAGWAAAAKMGHQCGDDLPLIALQTSQFDADEWEW